MCNLAFISLYICIKQIYRNTNTQTPKHIHKPVIYEVSLSFNCRWRHIKNHVFSRFCDLSFFIKQRFEFMYDIFYQLIQLTKKCNTLASQYELICKDVMFRLKALVEKWCKYCFYSCLIELIRHISFAL